MSAKVMVRARISVEVLNKIKAAKRMPRREWGKNLIPDYFGNWIEKYTETKEFEYLYKDAQIEALKAQVSTRDFFGKLKEGELTKARAEIERLKKELADLKNPPQAA